MAGLVHLNRTPHDPALERHIAVTLLDLTALALGASRDVAELAKLRGLRAARAQQVLTDIQLGASFTERVLEPRLQAARRMLTDPRHHHSKISDVALACGFGTISYFSDRFRRRFGESPTQCRVGTA